MEPLKGVKEFHLRTAWCPDITPPPHLDTPYRTSTGVTRVLGAWGRKTEVRPSSFWRESARGLKGKVLCGGISNA